MGNQNSGKTAFPLKGKSNSCYFRTNPSPSQSTSPHPLSKGFLAGVILAAGGWMCLLVAATAFPKEEAGLTDMTRTSGDFIVIRLFLWLQIPVH